LCRGETCRDLEFALALDGTSGRPRRSRVAALPLDRLDRKVTASVGDEAKAGIGEESPTSGEAGT